MTQESADGVVSHAVGKASEALQGRKAEQRIGRAGNDDRRPERLEVASRDWQLMSGKRQKTQYSLALEPTDRGEAPVGVCEGVEPLVAETAP